MDIWGGFWMMKSVLLELSDFQFFRHKSCSDYGGEDYQLKRYWFLHLLMTRPILNGWGLGVMFEVSDFRNHHRLAT